MSKQSKLSFSCPSCGVQVSLPASDAGATLHCQNCQAPMVVPGAQPKPTDEFDGLFEVEEVAAESDEDAVDQVTINESVDVDAPPAVPASTDDESFEFADVEYELEPIDELPAELLEEIPGEPAAADDELVGDWLRKTDSPAPEQRPEDPYADPGDLPIRIEGVSDPSAASGHFRVNCPVCDSVMFATSAMIGGSIKCSDCFTSIPVNAPADEDLELPSRTTKKPLLTDRENRPEPQLSAFPDQPDDEALILDSDDEGYTLEPLSEDLLQPRQESPVAGMEGYQLSTRHLDEADESKADPPRVVRSSDRPAPSRETKSDDAPPKVAAPAATAPARTKKSASGYDEPITAAIDKHEAELRAEEAKIPRGPVDESSLFRWPDRFLSPFRDTNALVYGMLVALTLGVAYFVLDFGMYLYGLDVNGVAVYRIFGVVIVMGSGGVYFLAMIFAGVLLNQLIEAAAYQRSDFHPPDMNPTDWLGSFLVVGVSYWAGVLPGIVIGQVLFAMTGSFWFFILCGMGSAFLLSPFGILSAYYNGSAFKIFSPDVFRTVFDHPKGWLKFYAWQAIWVTLYLVSFSLLAIPIAGNVLCVVVQTACLMLIGRTIGLLAQAFINNWVAET